MGVHINQIDTQSMSPSFVLFWGDCDCLFLPRTTYDNYKLGQDHDGLEVGHLTYITGPLVLGNISDRAISTLTLGHYEKHNDVRWLQQGLFMVDPLFCTSQWLPSY